VKAWLASERHRRFRRSLLARLVTNVSAAIAAYLGRPSLTPYLFTERLDGDGKARLFLRRYPVLAIASLVIDNVAVAAATVPAAGSSCPNGYLLEPWDGLPPGRLQTLDLFGAFYRKGRQNVVVGYTSGYAVLGESATVPSAPGPYTVTAAMPFGPWVNDFGVTYSNGTALTVVTGNPAAAQYSAANGVYTFAAADAGVLISYCYRPRKVLTRDGGSALLRSA
jgi:hypothetical protein